MSRPHVLSGSIAVFDERRGLGEVLAEDGQRFEFHATQIIDGRRRIEVGARVGFLLRPGPAGRYEAAAISEQIRG